MAASNWIVWHSLSEIYSPLLNSHTQWFSFRGHYHFHFKKKGEAPELENVSTGGGKWIAISLSFGREWASLLTFTSSSGCDNSMKFQQLFAPHAPQVFTQLLHAKMFSLHICRHFCSASLAFPSLFPQANASPWNFNQLFASVFDYFVFLFYAYKIADMSAASHFRFFEARMGFVGGVELK